MTLRAIFAFLKGNLVGKPKKQTLREQLEGIRENNLWDVKLLEEYNRQFWAEGGGCCVGCKFGGDRRYNDIGDRIERRDKRAKEICAKLGLDHKDWM